MVPCVLNKYIYLRATLYIKNVWKDIHTKILVITSGILVERIIRIESISHSPNSEEMATQIRIMLNGFTLKGIITKLRG